MTLSDYLSGYRSDIEIKDLTVVLKHHEAVVSGSSLQAKKLGYEPGDIDIYVMSDRLIVGKKSIVSELERIGDNIMKKRHTDITRITYPGNITDIYDEYLALESEFQLIVLNSELTSIDEHIKGFDYPFLRMYHDGDKLVDLSDGAPVKIVVGCNRPISDVDFGIINSKDMNRIDKYRKRGVKVVDRTIDCFVDTVIKTYNVLIAHTTHQAAILIFEYAVARK